jgi:hypothetical protein
LVSLATQSFVQIRILLQLLSLPSPELDVLAWSNTGEQKARCPHTETLPRSRIAFSPETVTCLDKYWHQQTHSMLSASESGFFTALHSFQFLVVGAPERHSFTGTASIFDTGSARCDASICCPSGTCTVILHGNRDQHNRAATTCDRPNTPQSRSDNIFAARKTIPAIIHRSGLLDASTVLRRSPLEILKDSWQARHTTHNVNQGPPGLETAHWVPRYFTAAKIVTYVAGVPYRQRSRSIK